MSMRYNINGNLTAGSDKIKTVALRSERERENSAHC